MVKVAASAATPATIDKLGYITMNHVNFRRSVCTLSVRVSVPQYWAWPRSQLFSVGLPATPNAHGLPVYFCTNISYVRSFYSVYTFPSRGVVYMYGVSELKLKEVVSYLEQRAKRPAVSPQSRAASLKHGPF